MKLTIISLLLISNFVFSQNKQVELSFDTKYYNAVDNWVVFPKKETDSTHAYGFIYIDQMAGITFRYEGLLKKSNNRFVSTEISTEKSTYAIISRLTNKTNNVYLINDIELIELGLEKEPNWLSIYKRNENSVEYLKDIGYHLNHVGAFEKALVPLLKAYKIEPHLNGLEFELSFAYNALKQFNKAIKVLEKAIKNNPNDYQFYKELGYSYMALKQINEAEIAYLKGMRISDNDFIKSEMCVNMAQAYFINKDKIKFNEWSERTLKYAKEDSQYAKYIEYFKKEWGKE